MQATSRQIVDIGRQQETAGDGGNCCRKTAGDSGRQRETAGDSGRQREFLLRSVIRESRHKRETLGAIRNCKKS